MQTLIIDRKGCRLSLAGKRIRLEAADQPPQFVPISMISRMVISAQTEIQSNVLGALACEGVSIIFLSSRDHRRTALVLPPQSGDHALRLQQYQMITRAEMVMDVARIIVRMKLHGQRRTLQQLHLSGTVARQAHRAFPDILAHLETAVSLESIRGYEGGAASLYFQAIAESAPASWNFTGRKRRPPPDPLNAMLSLSYTLLHYEAVHLIFAAGLDPCLGFLHAPEYSRESLACDCIEPMRSVADRFVINLFRTKILRPDHFSDQQGACRLGKAGRGIFYAAWAQFVPLPRRSIRRGINILKHALRQQT